MERVHRHLEERAALVDDVIQRERTHKEKVVLPGIHHEVNIHLVHDDRLPVRCICCSQQLAIDLASYHQGLAEVGHSYRQAERPIFRADNSHVTKCDGLSSFFR